MLKLTDLRKTTRRSGNEGMRVVYPRFLRDASLAPRIEMAIRYMERMLGQPRRALDDEVIVQLFGDHKVARCLVACMGAHYRHRPRTLAEVLPPDQVAGLAEYGIGSASELRLWLFRRVNDALGGFADGEQRAGFMADAAHVLGLHAAQMDDLFALDAPERAMLVRIGPRPMAADILARYNYSVAAALLVQSSLVRLTLARALSPAEAESVRTLADRAGVLLDLGGRELVAYGQRDALESWTRHGGRLAWLLATLLLCGLPARSGEALVAAPLGGEWVFRMDGDVLDFLGRSQTPQLTLADLVASQDLLARLMSDLAPLRRAGSLDGWSFRRAVEPLVADGRLALPLGSFVRRDERVALLPMPMRGDAGGAALAEVTPLLTLQLGGEGIALRIADMPYGRREDLQEMPRLLRRAIGRVERRRGDAQMEDACEEARSAGVLTEQMLAQRLGCAEEDVLLRLAVPAARAAYQRRGLEYVEGFGLCTSEILARVRRAASDMGDLAGNPQVGAAWKMRTLGRKLREVTGAHEGIECLIAWIGAA